MRSALQYDALHLLALNGACDHVSGANAAANGIAISVSTSEDVIRPVRVCAELDSYYSSPGRPQDSSNALSRAIIASLERNTQNA
jgi:hypothetical protein